MISIHASQELYLTDLKKEKDPKKKKKSPLLNDLVSEESLVKNYRILGKVLIKLKKCHLTRIILIQGEGIERLLIKDKKEQLDEKDGDSFKYFLLAGKHIHTPLFDDPE